LTFLIEQTKITMDFEKNNELGYELFYNFCIFQRSGDVSGKHSIKRIIHFFSKI